MDLEDFCVFSSSAAVRVQSFFSPYQDQERKFPAVFAKAMRHLGMQESELGFYTSEGKLRGCPKQMAPRNFQDLIVDVRLWKLLKANGLEISLDQISSEWLVDLRHHVNRQLASGTVCLLRNSQILHYATRRKWVGKDYLRNHGWMSASYDTISEPMLELRRYRKPDPWGPPMPVAPEAQQGLQKHKRRRIENAQPLSAKGQRNEKLLPKLMGNAMAVPEISLFQQASALALDCGLWERALQADGLPGDCTLPFPVTIPLDADFQAVYRQLHQDDNAEDAEDAEDEHSEDDQLDNEEM